MDAGPCTSGNVGTIIDEQGRVSILSERRDGIGNGKRGARRKIALAQLNQINACGNGTAQEINQRCRFRLAALGLQLPPVADQVDEWGLAFEDCFHGSAIAVESCVWCA